MNRSLTPTILSITIEPNQSKNKQQQADRTENLSLLSLLIPTCHDNFYTQRCWVRSKKIATCGMNSNVNGM